MKATAEKHKNVLVVDDEPIIAEHLSTILTRFGYTAVSASKGSEALAVLENSLPEDLPTLAIIDIVLGDENGIGLADQLVRKAPSMDILFMSGYINTAILTTQLPNGHKPSFIYKAFDVDDLISTIRNL